MFFAASRRPSFLRHLLMTGAVCCLVLPWDAVGAATKPSGQTVSPISQRLPEATPQKSAGHAPVWLWLLLGIAPVGVALPWLYRWHRSHHSLDPVAASKRTGPIFGPILAADPVALPAQEPENSAGDPLATAVSSSPDSAAIPLTPSSTQPTTHTVPDPLFQTAPPAEQQAEQQAEQTSATQPSRSLEPSRSLDQPLAAIQPSGQSLQGQTTRLAKIDIVEALTTDLHSPDSAKRRQAIWELGQRGDSRAIQPLVDLLIDADSQQRSLILAALAEISTRTLKPMQRALMISLQDESPDVRKNAIRDITRIYDLMAQASQLLQYAANDSDEDVQDTARWALGQLGRVRSAELGSQTSNPPLQPPD